MKQKEEKIKYKPVSFRLHKETYKKLKDLRHKEGISWNRLFYKFIKEYGE